MPDDVVAGFRECEVRVYSRLHRPVGVRNGATGVPSLMGSHSCRARLARNPRQGDTMAQRAFLSRNQPGVRASLR
jgi:hypothetical protein